MSREPSQLPLRVPKLGHRGQDVLPWRRVAMGSGFTEIGFFLINRSSQYTPWYEGSLMPKIARDRAKIL